MRKIYIAILVLLLLFALSLVFFYPLGRMMGGMLSHSTTGAIIAAYPDEIMAAAAKRSSGYITYDRVPLCLQQGIISVEDKRFFAHSGIDPFATVRVLFDSFRNDEEDHGGSTVSQQLARLILKIPRQQPNILAHLSSRLTVMYGTLILEHDYSKEKILELYLNSIYFGRGATGVGAAAKAYFDTPLGELDLGQCIFLAGLPQAPTIFGLNPSGDYAHSRYLHVVSTMERNGFVSADQAAALRTEALFKNPSQSE